MLLRHLRILFRLVGGNYSVIFITNWGSKISEGSLRNYFHFIFFFSVRNSKVGILITSFSLVSVVWRYLRKNSWRYTLFIRILLYIQFSRIIRLCECMMSRKCIINYSFSLSCLTTVILSDPRVLFSENKDLEKNLFFSSGSVWALGKELALYGDRYLELAV